MARWEWGYVPSLLSNPLPGTYISDGNSFVDGQFPALTAGAENTALDFEYFAYDRLVFAPRAGVPFPGRWGAVAWQQDGIHTLDAGPAWGVAHTVAGMSTDLDSGVHTGLYKFWGTDGKAYLGGFYRGATANETGAVVYDYETGAWTSWTTDLGHASFTAATYPVAYQGRLLLATQGRIYQLDPVAQRLTSMATGKTADPTDKLFVLAGRLFLVGQSSSVMKLYEVWANLCFELASLDTYSRGVGGDFAVLNDYRRVGIFWRGALRPGVGPPPDYTFDTYERYFYVEATSRTPLTPVTVVDNTFPNQGSLTLGVIPLTSARMIGMHEAEPDFFSQGTSARFLYLPGSGATASVHPQNRSTNDIWLFADMTGTRSFVSGTGVSQLSHASSRYGGQDQILNRSERTEPFKVEEDPTTPGALRIHYYAHTASPGSPGAVQSVRVYYRPMSALTVADALGTPWPSSVGAIPGALAGYDAPNGSLNANGKQIDDVPYTTNGESHYVVWDRVADLGADFDPSTPFRLVVDDAANLPAL